MPSLFCSLIVLSFMLSVTTSYSAEVKHLKNNGQTGPVSGVSPGVGFSESTTGMPFVLVKGGCFQMGDTFGDGASNEKPVHEVCVKDFAIGKFEVTQSEWQSIMGNNPSRFKQCGADCPVEQVSWDDVQEFTSKLNSKSGKHFRLPTEAEWEYAARSGGKKEKYAGFSDTTQLSRYANFCDSTCEYDWKSEDQNDGNRNTSRVGRFQSNGLGIYDMSGNVWEWCSDWYDKDYYSNSPKNGPPGAPTGQLRSLRGGSWINEPDNVRTFTRYKNKSGTRHPVYGFRLVLPKE